MHQKPTDELVDAERHLFPSAAVTVIAPLEGDRITIQLENAVVGDGDSLLKTRTPWENYCFAMMDLTKRWGLGRT